MYKYLKMKKKYQLKRVITILLCTLVFYSIEAQVTLSTDFTDNNYKNQPLHNIWDVANRISPKNGSNIRPGLKMNIVRMVGGIRKVVNGVSQKDLDFDPCLYDSINNTYVYRWEPLIERLNKVVNSQTEILQIALDQPPWAFQHGYTFIPEGTRDNINFRENEKMSIYGNSLPPANKQAYHDFIKALMTKLVETYGEDQVLKWRFRVGSEIETPEHWYGTKQDFIEHFENTEKAVRSILPNAIVGLHTRAPGFVYRSGTVLNYKGEPFASFVDDLIEYSFDNNLRYDFWGISDYVIIGNSSLRNMKDKYDKLFSGLVDHPKWNTNTKIDLMEYATVTTMNGADGKGFINNATSHAEIVELAFSNIFYKNKDKGLEFVYRWGNKTGTQDPPAIATLNTMNGLTHYTTELSGTPNTSTNELDAFFAKNELTSEYDAMIYNYNSNSLNYRDNELVNLSFSTDLPVGTTLYYRSLSYGEDNNKLQSFLKENPGTVKSGFNNRGDASRILTEAGLIAYNLYVNPNPHEFSEWTSVETTARTDGGSGSVITVNTELPSFAFQKFEFRSAAFFVKPIAPTTVIWTTTEDFLPWSAVTSGVVVNADNDKLSLSFSDGFAFPMAAITGLNINSELFGTLRMVIRNSTEKSNVQMAANVPGTGFSTSRKNITVPNDNEWRTIDVDLTDWALWTGIITEFKIYNSVKTGAFEIDSMEFIPLETASTYNVILTQEGNGLLNYTSGTAFTGQEFSLNAIAHKGWEFQGWTGDITSTDNPLDIIVNSDLNIKAVFTQKPLSVKENLLKDVIVYPNPSNDGIFNINVSVNKSWEVYSITGNKILTGNGDKVNISSFSQGIYILKIGGSFKKLLRN